MALSDMAGSEMTLSEMAGSEMAAIHTCSYD